MSKQKIILEPGNFYHIYNRGINGCALFTETTNYEHFLKLYNDHIFPIADTYAWVLMGNHFHLVVRIKTPDENPEGFQNLRDLGDLEEVKKYVTQKFSNLFNAYTKAFNKKYKRTGSLFEHTFRRNLVDSDEYLKQLILYIHNNPVHHGFCGHPIEYPWSSYLTCISVKPTKLKREAVIGWFDGDANFKYMHEAKIETEKIEKWLEF